MLCLVRLLKAAFGLPPLLPRAVQVAVQASMPPVEVLVFPSQLAPYARLTQLLSGPAWDAAQRGILQKAGGRCAGRAGGVEGGRAGQGGAGRRRRSPMRGCCACEEQEHCSAVCRFKGPDGVGTSLLAPQALSRLQFFYACLAHCAAAGAS